MSTKVNAKSNGNTIWNASQQLKMMNDSNKTNKQSLETELILCIFCIYYIANDNVTRFFLLSFSFVIRFCLFVVCFYFFARLICGFNQHGLIHMKKKISQQLPKKPSVPQIYRNLTKLWITYAIRLLNLFSRHNKLFWIRHVCVSLLLVFSH